MQSWHKYIPETFKLSVHKLCSYIPEALGNAPGKWWKWTRTLINTTFKHATQHNTHTTLASKPTH